MVKHAFYANLGCRHLRLLFLLAKEEKEAKRRMPKGANNTAILIEKSARFGHFRYFGGIQFANSFPKRRRGAPVSCHLHAKSRRIAAALSAERLCFFLFAIQKERRKPPALHQGRRPGRGAAGLFTPTVKPFWDLTAQNSRHSFMPYTKVKPPQGAGRE